MNATGDSPFAQQPNSSSSPASSPSDNPKAGAIARLRLGFTYLLNALHLVNETDALDSLLSIKEIEAIETSTRKGAQASINALRSLGDDTFVDNHPLPDRRKFW